ncbi:GFA family protein [Paracoccus sp. MC1862]|uniref:GFA family protein n=2 Tax=unclassified Paracoccus (in: a-proteobacteria) TaxID=2688777 RepID=UPI0016041E89|nr:GFA family protein [Paracoccus sp. MC1862]MBB1499704.1 GFA family protein [Paracoccus sp. MC1862]QQO44232.1 GFA family protein [Paracoccus sp. MC1862]
MTTKHYGSCLCGAVEIEVTGTPVGMGYCHCASCRHWSAGPVNAFTLWHPEQVHIPKGEEHLAGYSKTPASDRMWCTVCGGHLMTVHPGLKLIDVFAAILPSIDFQPTPHVNYTETVLHLHDDLPKMNDFPAELGGSGLLVPE